MKKSLLILLSLSSVYSSYGQQIKAKYKPLSDSINLIIIEERLSNIKSRRIVDSLQRELLFYKVKDNLYSDEISSLGSLYSAVMAIIATAITGLGVGYVIKNLNDTKTELDNKIKAVADNGAETELTLYASYLHFLITQGKSAENEAKRHYNNEQWLSSIAASMDSVRHYCTIKKINSEHLNNEYPENEIEGAIKNALSFINMTINNFESKVARAENLPQYKRSSYIQRLTILTEDEDLENSIVKSTSSEVRAIFYEKIIKMRLLLKELKK